MKSERLKSILVIIGYALIFLVSEIFGAILIKYRPTNLLALLVYPSLAFWIAMILSIVIEKKNLINRNVLVQTYLLSILFLWAASFSLIPLYFPATAFMLEENISFRWQIFRLPSITLFKTGWFLIIAIILLWYRQREEKKESKKGTGCF